MTTPLTGRIALVTGASRGIGYATSLALARAGAHIVAVARTVGGLEELDDAIRAVGGTATLVPLDLKDHAGILRLSGAINERYQKLDILIGNAGVLGMLSPLGHVEPKDWDDVIAINLTANWHLVRAFDMLLKLSDAGRVVFVTSTVGASPLAYWGPYGASKAGLDALAFTYAAETLTTNVRVNLLNPGATRTRMRASAMPGEDPLSLKTSDDVAERIVGMCLPTFQDTGKVYDYREGRLLTPRPPG